MAQNVIKENITPNDLHSRILYNLEYLCFLLLSSVVNHCFLI